MRAQTWLKPTCVQSPLVLPAMLSTLSRTLKFSATLVGAPGRGVDRRPTLDRICPTTSCQARALLSALSHSSRTGPDGSTSIRRLLPFKPSSFEWPRPSSTALVTYGSALHHFPEQQLQLQRIPRQQQHTRCSAQKTMILRHQLLLPGPAPRSQD